MPCWHWRGDRISDRDTVPAGINNCSLSVGQMNRILAGNLADQSATLPAGKSHERRSLWDRLWIRKRKTIHLQKGLGRQLMLSDSIIVRTQERRCRRKSTGCWWMKLTVRTSWKQRKNWLSNLVVATTKNVFISILAVLPLIWHEKVPFLMKKLLTFCFRQNSQKYSYFLWCEAGTIWYSRTSWDHVLWWNGTG